MKTYDIYGLKNSDLKMVLITVEIVLGSKFEIRESIYYGGEYYRVYGGEYYRVGEASQENFILQQNFNIIEQEWNQEEFLDMVTVLYVNNIERAEELKNLLTDAIPEIKLLKRRQI